MSQDFVRALVQAGDAELDRLRAEVELLKATIKEMETTEHGYIDELRAEIERLRAQVYRRNNEIERLRAHFTEIIVLQNRAISGEGLFMRAILIAKRALYG